MLVKLSKILGKTGLVLKQQSSSIFSAKRPPNTSLDVSKFSDSLNQSKPMTLNQGLSKFVRKVRTSLGENCSKQEP
jgi:hypothetical protein